jgi:hypothetical protein
MKSGYKVHTEAEVTLAAAGTNLHLLGVSANANFGIALKEIWVDFDSVTSSDKPVIVRVSRCTFATNAPATNSTSVTVKQSWGRHANTGFAAARNWTAAPTVIETVPEERFRVDANKGMYRYPWPLGEEPDSALGEGWLLSVEVAAGDTASGAVEAGMRFTRA